MKKFLSLLIVFTLIFTFTACDNKEQTPVDEDFWEYDHPFAEDAKYESLEIEYKFAPITKYKDSASNKNFVVFAIEVLSKEHTIKKVRAYDKDGNKLSAEYNIQELGGFACQTNEFHKNEHSINHENDQQLHTVLISSEKNIDFNDFSFKIDVSHVEDSPKTMKIAINAEAKDITHSQKFIHGATMFYIDDCLFATSGVLGSSGTKGQSTAFNAIRIIPLHDFVEPFTLSEKTTLSAVYSEDGSDYEVPDGYELYYSFSQNSAGVFLNFGLKAKDGIIEEDMIVIAQKLCPKVISENNEFILFNVSE